MRNKKTLEDGKTLAEACFGALCWNVIRYAKNGDGKWAAGAYNQLIGACMVYGQFIDEPLNRIELAQALLKAHCNVRKEDYEKIIRFVLHFAIEQ